MPIWKQALLRRLQDPAESGGTGGGGLDTTQTQTGEQTPPKTEGGGDDEAAAKAAKKLSDDAAALLKENMQKKEKLKELSGELANAQAVLAQLQELGGLDAVKSLVTQKKEAETKELEAKGQWDRLQARMAEEHAKEKKTLAEQLESERKAREALTSQITDLTVGSAFTGSKFISEDLLLTPSKTRVVYGDRFDIVDGKVVGFDKPRGAADRTPLVDSSGNPVPFDEALRKIVDADPERDAILRNKTKPGAGSTSKAEKTVIKSQTEMNGLSKISAGMKSLGVLAGQ
jgi:hypothetical protein